MAGSNAQEAERWPFAHPRPDRVGLRHDDNRISTSEELQSIFADLELDDRSVQYLPDGISLARDATGLLELC